ncbi:hypothetical protein SDRG_02031 [Saprolegnia diclina VS20]|uniref:Uncharacterized protein n=1 Tax=Saprolegnia diclina (strain VS20) TaxID=1156394 RepID=T0QS82_SAPDV|nr:hypothetical protein SDRG_02031 [Saprolegnia diclina VS20]EQC40969.1 hypothetical protein SDRG_02031 [Saprolegnia diclina VS20]|eukprot:XP_008605813.1 hypothetical protein SDRG_02031 [Saprolegnia diclina VS20]
METLAAEETAWSCSSRSEWMVLLPTTPIYVYDIWHDLVQRKPLRHWRLVVDKSASEAPAYIVLGDIPIQAMHDGKRNRNAVMDDPVRIAVICHDDNALVDLEQLSALRCRLAAMTPGLDDVFLTITNATYSIHYYALQASLGV